MLYEDGFQKNWLHFEILKGVLNYVLSLISTEIVEYCPGTNETTANESIHHVHGWQFYLNFSHHDCGNDDFQANEVNVDSGSQ